MGTAKKHAIGERREIRVKLEDSYGTFKKPTNSAPGSIQVEGLTINHNAGERIDRKYVNSLSRGINSRITGKKLSEWSLDAQVRPSGSAGTPPEIHPLLKNLLAAYTNTGSTSDVYEPSATQGAGGSLTIVDHAQDLMRSLVGGWVEELKISQAGPMPPLLSFSGKGKDVIPTGRGVVDTGGVSGANITLNSAVDAKAFDAGSVVVFKDATTGAVVDDNSGDGWKVNSRAAAVLTLEGAPPSAAQTNIVEPFTPAPSFTGTALGGFIGTITITPSGESGITDLEVEKIDWSIKSIIRAHDDVAFSATPVDYTEGRLEARCALTLKLRRDQWHWFGRYQADPSSEYALVTQWGATAGSIFKVEMAQCEVDGLPTEFPAEGLCKCTLNFYGKTSANNTNNQVKVTFQ